MLILLDETSLKLQLGLPKLFSIQTLRLSLFALSEYSALRL